MVRQHRICQYEASLLSNYPIFNISAAILIMSLRGAFFCDEAISERLGEIASPREKRPGLAMTPQIENC